MLNRIILKKYFCKTLKGFTLLEVMIVISIISIMAGFMIPKFVGYENKAKTVKAINTGKQIYNAVMCAYSDKGSSVSDHDIVTSINELTGMGLADEDVNVNSTTTTVDVDYNSDSKEYTLSVTASDGSYAVKDGTVKIFPQTATQTDTNN
jgi:type IV pilus assembly protein PilA